MEILKKFFKEERGQGLIEFALIVSLIAIVAIVALGLVGQSMRSTLVTSAEAIAN